MKPLLIACLAASAALVGCGKTAEVTAPDPEPSIFSQYPIGLQKIADGVWVHTSIYSFPGAGNVPSNGLVVEEEDGLILIDTAWGEMATGALLEKLKTETGKDVKKLVITNHHFSRLAGVDMLERQGVTVFTHPQTPTLSAALATPVPDTSVASLTEAGSRNKVGPIEIAYPGPGNTADNLVVYVPASKVLFAGTIVRGKGSPALSNFERADMKSWPKSLSWIKQTYPEASLVVPGHGKGSKLDLIDDTLALIAKQVNSAETPAKP